MCWRNAMFQYNHHVFNMYMFQFFYSSSPTCWAMKRCNDAAEPAPWERYKRARGPPMVPQPQDSQSTPLAAGPTQAQEGVPGTSPVPESTELDDVLNFLVDKSQEMSGQHADGGSDTAGTAASSSSSGLPKEEIATAPPMDPSVVENKAKVENTKYTMGPSKRSFPTAPPPLGGPDSKKLVVDPYQMKHFLYGTPTGAKKSEEKNEDEWSPSSQASGWQRKMSGLIVAWRLGEVHRMRRLLQRWESFPEMKRLTESLSLHIKKYGWPKNLEGDYSLAWPTRTGSKKVWQKVHPKSVEISIQISELKSKQLRFQFRFLNWNPNSWGFNSDFWIEIQTVEISIQISELKSKQLRFQFRFLNWKQNS